MTLEDFWTIIGTVHRPVQGAMGYACMDAKTLALEAELEKLPAEEIVSFSHHFAGCMHDAYSWQIWDAAIVLDGGCDRDEFFGYFRANLISFGKQVFEGVMADPDSLGDLGLILDEPGYFSCRSDFGRAPRSMNEKPGQHSKRRASTRPNYPAQKFRWSGFMNFTRNARRGAVGVTVRGKMTPGCNS